jgi:hypothetical protein
MANQKYPVIIGHKHDLGQEFKRVATNAQDILVKAESVFPFTLFRDTICVSRMKVAITKRDFFRVAEVISLQHEDILNVEVDMGVFFGSLKIFTRIYGTEPLRINMLPRGKAIEIKRLIEGFIIACRQHLDLNELTTGDLKNLVERLGTDSPMT